MRLLLAEDDPMIGESIRAALHRHGFAIDWVREPNVVEVSVREFAVLHALMEHPGRILSRTQLEERLYGWDEIRGQRYNSRSPENVVAEMKWLKKPMRPITSGLPMIFWD